MQARFLGVAVGGILAVAAQGCLTVSDDDGPVLSIELFWDARPESSEFFAGTCDQADVQWIEWTLYRVEPDGERIEVDSNSQPCVDLIEEFGLRAGDYELDIIGRNDDDEPIWQVTCGEPDNFLTVVRFDAAYFCDIEAP